MTEQPKYKVLQKDRNIELRAYNGYIRAEVDVSDNSYRSAIYRGFNPLAGYIFGNNTQAAKIAMTTPVQVENSQKIAMTKPVLVSGEGQYTVSFIMPSEYSIEDLPNPKNDAIRFVVMDPHKMAVIRFSGFFGEEKVHQKKQELLEWVEKNDLSIKGDFIVAGYNPPWVPGFLARNEVMIRVSER